ncbi:EH domain [Trinorchestia longiramus]|nr:EH domain [Trinorchestia longiramus]
MASQRDERVEVYALLSAGIKEVAPVERALAKLIDKFLVIVERPLFTPAIHVKRLERGQRLMNYLESVQPCQVIIFSDEKTLTVDLTSTVQYSKTGLDIRVCLGVSLWTVVRDSTLLKKRVLLQWQCFGAALCVVSDMAAADPWIVTPGERAKHEEQFRTLSGGTGMVSGDAAKKFFLQSRLPPQVLGVIWSLADINGDGKLDLFEFSIACKLINLKIRGGNLPPSLPPQLKQTACGAPAAGAASSQQMLGGLMTGPIPAVQPTVDGWASFSSSTASPSKPARPPPVSASSVASHAHPPARPPPVHYQAPPSTVDLLGDFGDVMSAPSSDTPQIRAQDLLSESLLDMASIEPMSQEQVSLGQAPPTSALGQASVAAVGQATSAAAVAGTPGIPSSAAAEATPEPVALASPPAVVAAAAVASSAPAPAPPAPLAAVPAPVPLAAVPAPVPLAAVPASPSIISLPTEAPISSVTPAAAVSSPPILSPPAAAASAHSAAATSGVPLMQPMMQPASPRPMGVGMGAAPITPLPASMSSMPAAVPTMPAAMPTMPAAMPTMPAAMPTMPAAMPTMPAAMPTMPAAMPTMPAAMPTMPAAMPTMPLTMPSAMPTMPAATPIMPGVMPGGPAIVPGVAPAGAATVTRTGSQDSGESVGSDWGVPQASKLKFTQVFNAIDRNKSGFLSGVQARNILVQSKLPNPLLAQIWGLSDVDGDGQLSCEEFVLALYLCEQTKAGVPLPPVLPPKLIPPTQRRASIVSLGSGGAGTGGAAGTPTEGE